MVKNKTFITSLLITVSLGAIIAILSIFNFFEKLDLRLYDGMLKLLKDPPRTDQVVVVEISDEDINMLGEWPWSRDIMADALLRMKELGAYSAVFDIEYINSSPKGLKASSIAKMSEKIHDVENMTSDIVFAIPDAVNQGYSVSDLNDLSEDMISSYLYPMYDDLYDYVENNIAADNDEYFSKAVQFFGNAWMTANIVDLGYEGSTYTKKDIDYIRNRLLYLDVEDENGYTANDNKYNFNNNYPHDTIGFTPTLNTIIQKANGIGYTNSNVDEDGVRRRNELLYEYDGKYLGQLVFAPLMNILDTNKITRNKSSLIIHDALMPGAEKRKDIKIPLDTHGQMLINWQHETSDKNEDFFGIKSIKVLYLHMLDLYEADIINSLKFITNEFTLFDESGNPLEYYEAAQELLSYYDYIDSLKEDMLSRCNGYDANGNPIETALTQEDYDTYFGERMNFYNAVMSYADAGYQNEVIEIMTEALGEDGADTIQEVELAFNTISQEINYFMETFNNLKQIFNGSFCIIGQTAASTTDIGAIPFAKQYANVGIHANIMNTILTENFIISLPWYYAFAVSLIVNFLLLLFVNKSSSFQNFVGGITSVLLISGFIILFVVFKIYVPIVGPVIIFVLSDYFAGIIFRYLMTSRERRFITEIASSFANKDTVEQLRRNPESFKTEGQKKYITALFSDIQKFSTFSEKMDEKFGDEGPNKLIELLNEYLGAMSNDILYNNGNIDKYEGDAIISMFGAPDPFNSHSKNQWAYNCLDSAIRMKKTEEEFNRTHFNPDDPENSLMPNPFHTRIGINSGEAFVGLMGSKTENFSKLNYTMIGDTVNLASRLEGVNKAYGSWIMCSDSTWELANSGENEGKIIARKLDRVRVVGRSTPVQLYNVIGFASDLSPQKREEIDIFNAALNKYLARDFVNAGKLFLQASQLAGEDPTALIFAERCKTYLEKGVPENWDGVMNLTSK